MVVARPPHTVSPWQDAAKAGFKTWCLLDASRGIGEDTIAKKKAEMEAAGVSVAPAWREVLPRK